MTRAIVIIDVQNDFCEGGSLAVAGGGAVAEGSSRHLATVPAEVHVVATQDAHLDPGSHFADHPDFVDSWPAHCVIGTVGAQFHPSLDTSRVAEIFRKGAYAAAYSGFEGTAPDGSTLAEWLRARDVTSVEVVGIATDYCVRATALDAVRAGFATTVRLGLTAAVSESTATQAVEEMRGAGVTVTP